MTKLTFVVGKGGVGKTTVSCAYALQLATRRPTAPILLLSTDPAHSLADILKIRLNAAPGKVPGRGKLFAWQIHAEKEFHKFLSGNRDAILDIIESGSLFSRDEIAPLLDTTLPGMAEVAGLLAIQELLRSGKYQHIVVDTAPFGHTLRLFELPAHFQRFLNFLNVASQRDELLAERFGGRRTAARHVFLEEWRETVQQLRAAFASRDAELMLVTSAEKFSLREADRSLRSLEKDLPELRLTRIVLNRVVNSGVTCVRCRRRAAAAHRSQKFLKSRFPQAEVFLGIDPGNPILGVSLLRRFGAVVFGGQRLNLNVDPPQPTGRTLQFRRGQWPDVGVPLAFTVGKGGVGKTTTTAALGFHLRTIQPELAVTVCSTDPASSLDDIFQRKSGSLQSSIFGDAKFQAIEVDSASEFRRWAGQMTERLNSGLSTESGGLHIDLTFEREVFTALMEVVPPGIHEIFSILRILQLLQRRPGGIFIDMAPTGHALELLRTPERIQLWSRLLLKSLASHRTLSLAQDVAVELAALGQQVRKLLATLKDPKQSRACVVMLPEPVPDRQTMRLLQAIQEMGICVDSLFVNRVLMLEDHKVSCSRCRRARAWQTSILQTLTAKYRQFRIFVTPERPTEISGAAPLKRFTSKLWQIVE